MPDNSERYEIWLEDVMATIEEERTAWWAKANISMRHPTDGRPAQARDNASLVDIALNNLIVRINSIKGD